MIGNAGRCFFLSLVYDTHGHCKKEGEGFRISSPPPMTGERNGHQRQTLMKTLHDLFVVGEDSLVDGHQIGITTGVASYVMQ